MIYFSFKEVSPLPEREGNIFSFDLNQEALEKRSNSLLYIRAKINIYISHKKISIEY